MSWPPQATKRRKTSNLMEGVDVLMLEIETADSRPIGDKIDEDGALNVEMETAAWSKPGTADCHEPVEIAYN